MVEEKDNDHNNNIRKRKEINLFEEITKKGDMDIENKNEDNNYKDNNKNEEENYTEINKDKDKQNIINDTNEIGYSYDGNLYNNDKKPIKNNEYIEEENVHNDYNDPNSIHIMNLRSGNKKISYGLNYANNKSQNQDNSTKYHSLYNNESLKYPQEKDSKQNTILFGSSNNNNLEGKEKEQDIEEEEEILEGEIYNIVCNVIPSKNQIILYNVDKDSIVKKDIDFSPLLGISHFLQECAWVNNNNKLYILGGVDDFTKSSNIFLEYDPIKEKLRRLPDSKFSHSRHSLFAYNEQIFVVGGDKLECERYDINKNEWSTLPNLSFKQIYPVLYVHNDILYSFFGIDENIKKTDNIQKLNLRNNKSKWQKVNYKRNKCNLCVFGCGIAKINDNCVLFLGGMDDNGIRDEAIQFDFSNLSAKKTEFLLEEKAYFKDSVLLRLSQKDFGNFSIEESHPFLKIKFQVNVKKMN